MVERDRVRDGPLASKRDLERGELEHDPPHIGTVARVRDLELAARRLPVDHDDALAVHIGGRAALADAQGRVRLQMSRDELWLAPAMSACGEAAAHRLGMS